MYGSGIGTHQERIGWRKRHNPDQGWPARDRDMAGHLVPRIPPGEAHEKGCGDHPRREKGMRLMRTTTQ